MSGDFITVGKKDFLRRGKTYVCGILNVTPDSFSEGGKWKDKDKALRHVEEMLREGADLVDVGGESTRPGCTPVTEEEEIARVIPVAEAIKSRFDIPVSLDTYKSGTAREGIAAGVDLINDVSGLKSDPALAAVIACSGLPCCLTHSRREAVYEDFWEDLRADLTETLRLAREAGIGEDKIILDPGIGFGKTYEQNLDLLGGMDRLKSFGCPLLLGCSRKSVIGQALDLPVDERLEGTIVTTVLAVMKGYSFVRVHDVKENVRAVRMAEAILYG